jgi:hypothetical protein
VVCPASRASYGEISEFALTYDGYQRLGENPTRLLQVVRPVIRAVRQEKAVPRWCGIDLLRGALFYLQREAHFTEYVSVVNDVEMRSVVDRIREVAGDRPLANDREQF